MGPDSSTRPVGHGRTGLHDVPTLFQPGYLDTLSSFNQPAFKRHTYRSSLSTVHYTPAAFHPHILTNDGRLPPSSHANDTR